MRHISCLIVSIFGKQPYLVEEVYSLFNGNQFCYCMDFCFSTHFKGESPQEERRGREENGKRKGKGAYSCALLSFVVKNSNFLHICMYLCMQTETHVPVRLVLIIKNSSLMNTSNF